MRRRGGVVLYSSQWVTLEFFSSGQRICAYGSFSPPAKRERLLRRNVLHQIISKKALKKHIPGLIIVIHIPVVFATTHLVRGTVLILHGTEAVIIQNILFPIIHLRSVIRHVFLLYASASSAQAPSAAAAVASSRARGTGGCQTPGSGAVNSARVPT